MVVISLYSETCLWDHLGNRDNLGIKDSYYFSGSTVLQKEKCNCAATTKIPHYTNDWYIIGLGPGATDEFAHCIPGYIAVF